MYPFKLQQCDCCGKTIWKFNDFHMQCPSCGATTTNYGGIFPYLSPYGGKWIITEDMKKIVLESNPDYIF